MEAENTMTGSVLGIDIGSVSLSLVQMDLSGRIRRAIYRPHRGQVRDCLVNAGKDFDLSDVRGIGCTSSSFLMTGKVLIYNPQVAFITAARALCKEARSILVVGAEKFMVIKLSSDGTYESTLTNSSCAAGTGSFLDQQSLRLNLSGAEELSRIAMQNTGPIPEIASRCAVFAKTDLIHAQQQGYGIEAICDSLCKGLALNIADTLFSKEPPAEPVLFIGGVSKNAAVIKHLEAQINSGLLHHEHSHLFGSIGVCYLLAKEKLLQDPGSYTSLDAILLPEDLEKEYFYKPLVLSLSEYPDFSADESYRFTPAISGHTVDVEADLYVSPEKNTVHRVFLGIDIGSTSTKAMIIDEKGSPLAGFYTYTAGRPLEAVKAILEAISDNIKRKKIKLEFLGVGTTGSGRKFIGKIIHADRIIDEITAHAKAAYELHPETDTIIEIGGQDAKFTLMHQGRVTFSQMNAVCAAGTGSFLEEQARKLGCELSDYSEKSGGVIAPMASDRCTVFMERDISQLLNKGYSVSEILATALHSVRENYLKKVALEASIGEHICFQGATAKNKSLVAAFEQKLNRKIYVSKYCHLTGALGTALLLREENLSGSRFRGLSIFKTDIPVTNEPCELCSNHCSISLATIQGETEAYGFMCGRDYHTKKYVRSGFSGLDPLEKRNSLFVHKPQPANKKGPVIGIPASLHLFEELYLWKKFFGNLSIRVVTSENYLNPVKSGKRIAGAEFCAPVDSMYGSALFLAERADYLFIPVILQARDKPDNAMRNFCYYTQFSSALIHALKVNGIQERCLSPLLDFSKGTDDIARKLFHCLRAIIPPEIIYPVMKRAFKEALEDYLDKKKKLVDIFKNEFNPQKDLSVVLLGRPYVILSKSMNKGIPDIFAGMGIKIFFQDMIPVDDGYPEQVELQLDKIPWYFAAKILETARVVAAKPNLYPVLVTAFKCAPDSFIIEYFKKIMHAFGKPYLILQIDEHDSNTGYETRIEAAIRSFRNHAASPVEITGTEVVKVMLYPETKINGKTLLFPNWDSLVAPLLVANLRRAGIDVRLMHPDGLTIRKSMARNTGQCLPLNIITQEFIDYVEYHGLKPENTMLWMADSKLSCNLPLYPSYIKSLLESYGKGFEKADVYLGQVSNMDISLTTCYYTYFAYMLGGLIRRLGCRIRPYETVRGMTDEAIEKSIPILMDAFLGIRAMDDAVAEATALFGTIPKREGHKPRVAIFGDFYVRDNDIMNQDLIHAIEDAGGEVVTTPYNDYVRITFENAIRRLAGRGEYYKIGQYRIILGFLKIIEDKYYKYFKPYLGKKPVIQPRKLEKHLSAFNVKPYHSGESFDNILKIFYILENHPDISLFVQTNPSFCCPSLVTEAMTSEIKRITGIPVVTITYDGTTEYKNDVIVPYLHAGISF